VKPQKDTFSSTVSGNAAAASEAFVRRTVPIDAVGHATSAISARRVLSGDSGCVPTYEWPSPGAKTSGAIRRHVSQSMHVRST
jgi:hypothetical protein